LEDCPPCGEQYDFEELFLKFLLAELAAPSQLRPELKRVCDVRRAGISGQLFEIVLLAARRAVLQMVRMSRSSSGVSSRSRNS